MLSKSEVDYVFEQSGDVGVFYLKEKLGHENKNHLKTLLMKAIYSFERAVLNFEQITGIDKPCIQLLREAYKTSIRLSKPIILTGIPNSYISEIFDSGHMDNKARSFNLNISVKKADSPTVNSTKGDHSWE